MKSFFNNSYPENVISDMEMDDYLESSYRSRNIIDRMVRTGIFNRERREIYNLYYLFGMEVDDISEWLGKNEKHIRKELSKILHILRKNRLLLLPEMNKQNKGGRI